MSKNTLKVGWIGTGRMGLPMAERLLKAGYDVSVWNRTRAKAEPLAKSGGKLVDKIADLASCDVVFSIVSTGKDLAEVSLGAGVSLPPAASCPASWSTARPFRSRTPPTSASG
jgi:3-hydroxyisobutyrate dehydrogenase